MMHSRAGARFAPWAGLVAGAAGWALHHQAIADMLHFDCHLGDGYAGLAAGIAIVAVLAAAGLLSWRSRRSADASAARHFIGAVSTLAAALFAFAIGLQSLASVLLPGCGA